MEKSLVLPGDAIAAAEEYEAGEGTYEKDGHIYAATPGLLDLDSQNFVARVRPFNPLAELKVGDIVYGAISDIRSSMAEATVAAVHGSKREITGETEGAIHVSKISSEYIEDIHDAFHLGDIVRAKVIQAKPSLQLATADSAAVAGAAGAAGSGGAAAGGAADGTAAGAGAAGAAGAAGTGGADGPIGDRSSNPVKDAFRFREPTSRTSPENRNGHTDAKEYERPSDYQKW